jgi:hypothetical protein
MAGETTSTPNRGDDPVNKQAGVGTSRCSGREGRPTGELCGPRNRRDDCVNKQVSSGPPPQLWVEGTPSGGASQMDTTAEMTAHQTGRSAAWAVVCCNRGSLPASPINQSLWG